MQGKSLAKKISAIVLVIAFIATMIPAAFATASSGSVATFTDVGLSLDENYEGDFYWVIELTADKEIGFGDNSYWYRNLQQHNVDDPNRSEEYVNAIRQNILINGKSIEDGLSESTDQATSTRVKVGNYADKNANKLWIAVQAEFVGRKENVYGVNDYSDFTLEFKEGITLNSFSIEPIKLKYRSYDKTFKIDTGKSEFVEARFECVNAENEQYYLITLKSESSIGFGDGSKTYSNLQLRNTDNQELNALAEVLCDCLVINGKTVREGLSAAADQNYSTRIKIGNKTDGTDDILSIAVSREDNPYGITADADFTIEIKDGITLNGIDVQPAEYRYCAELKKMVKDDGSAQFLEAKVIIDEAYENGKYYVMAFRSEKEIGFGDNGYWYRNLQQISDAAGDEHNALAKELRSNIIIAGKSIDNGLRDAADKATSTRIKIGCVSSQNTQNYLYIAIKVDDNQYGISLTSDFTVAFKEGITLNGEKIAASVWRYTAATGEMTVDGSFESAFDDSWKDDPDGAIIKKASISEVSSPSCNLHGSGAAWIIKLETNKSFGSNNSYFWRHLQADTGNTITNNADILDKIKLNGKTLGACKGDGDLYAFLHIRVVQNSKTIEIEIPKNNTFGFNGDEDFTVQIEKGVKINGIEVNPRRITYTADAQSEKFRVETFKPEAVKTTTAITGASMVKTQGFCSSSGHHDTLEWIIRLEADEDISAHQNPNYYDRHLQVTNDETLRNAIQNKVKINGKTIRECLQAADLDDHKEIHIKTSGKLFEIAIPVNNQYDFDGDTDFTVGIFEGITLNGFTIEPVIVVYTSQDDKFVLEENIAKPEPSVVTGVELENDSDKYWRIKINVDKDITVSGEPAGDLQYMERQPSTERKELSEQLMNKIAINGETILRSMQRAGNHYTVRIQAVGNQLILKLNKKSPVTIDNDFHISDADDFTVSIKDSLIISGKVISPTKYRWDTENRRFVLDDSPDIEQLAEAKLNIVGSEIGENGKGISFWPGGTSRYIHILLDGMVALNSHNAETFADEHGEQCRQYIYVDGLSVSEWIAYGEGELYQVMVRFKGNIIEFLFDGSREPGMVEDEVHWLEIKNGLYSASGEKIVPCKLYYSPKTGLWEIVDSFVGLEKPWVLNDYEIKTKVAQNGRKANASYVLNWYDGDEKALSEKMIAYEKALEEFLSKQESINGATEIDPSEADSDTKGKSVVKKVRKVMPIVYEDYFPVWAIVLIAVGALGAVGAVVFFVVKRKNKSKIK